jgi:hypothetical protein
VGVSQVFMFCAPDLFSTVPMVPDPIFMFCAPRLVFDGTEGAESSFHVLRSLTHFRRNRWHWVHFSCLALPISFSAVRRAPSLVFMFYAPELFFGGTEGSSFNVLRSNTHF